MKATGIVRRIDAGVIITPKPKKRINTRVFASLPHPTHWCQNRVLAVLYIAKARGIPLAFKI